MFISPSGLGACRRSVGLAANLTIANYAAYHRIFAFFTRGGLCLCCLRRTKGTRGMTVTTVLRKPIAASTDSLLCDFLRRHAQQKPDQAAFICGDRAITWSALDQTSTSLAHWLLGQGLQPGDRVAVCSLNSIELVQVYLGLFKAGLVAVPINTRLKPEEVRYILGHAGTRMAFCEPCFTPLVEQAGAAFPVFGALPEAPAQTCELPDTGPDSLAMIVYTSGTTARPKGVAHTHGSLSETGLNGSRLTPDMSDHVRLLFLPLMHISGVWLVSAVLREGTPMILLPRFEPGAALDAIEKFGCTTTGGLPTMLLMMVEEQLARPREVSTLRSVIGGGDVVSPTLQHRFKEVFGLGLHEIYAMTELCPMTANRPDLFREGSVGVPLEGVELRVVDLDGRDVADGETGEIIARGPARCAGNWTAPETTRA